MTQVSWNLKTLIAKESDSSDVSGCLQKIVVDRYIQLFIEKNIYTINPSLIHFLGLTLYGPNSFFIAFRDVT